ncbi:MAG: AMP-binding protein [Ilumatobacteraceae bacterium]
MVAEIADRVPSLEKAVFFWTDEWNHLYEGDEYVSDDELNTRRDSLRPMTRSTSGTSGTTGFPKGATLTHRNILNNGYFVAELQGFNHGDRLCIPVPFYHCFGMVMGNLGCTSHAAMVIVRRVSTPLRS